MATWRGTLAPYREFARIGFVNILAFRLRYYTGIITYLLNVTVYYYIWTAVLGRAARNGGMPSRDTTSAQMLTYVSVGWMIRSFYWNTIDQEMAYEVLEGKIAMELIKPVSVQGMWLARAAGESAFRLLLLTVPTAALITLVFPVQRPGIGGAFRAVSRGGCRELSADGRDQFSDRDLRDSAALDSVADSREILADRAAFRLADSHRFFSQAAARCFRSGCPLSTSPTRRCRFILAS